MFSVSVCVCVFIFNLYSYFLFYPFLRHLQETGDTHVTQYVGRRAPPPAPRARPEDAAPASATRSDEAPGELNYEAQDISFHQCTSQKL